MPSCSLWLSSRFPLASADSFCGQEINRIIASNLQSDSSVENYFRNLAISAIVLPLFALLDIFSCFPRLNKRDGWIKLIRICCMTATIPFIIFANIFGLNCLPSVSDPIDQLKVGSDNPGKSEADLRYERLCYIADLKAAISKYKKGKLTFSELAELRENNNWYSLRKIHLAKKDLSTLSLLVDKNKGHMIKYEPLIKIAFNMPNAKDKISEADLNILAQEALLDKWDNPAQIPHMFLLSQLNTTKNERIVKELMSFASLEINGLFREIMLEQIELLFHYSLHITEDLLTDELKKKINAAIAIDDQLMGPYGLKKDFERLVKKRDLSIKQRKEKITQSLTSPLPPLIPPLISIVNEYSTFTPKVPKAPQPDVGNQDVSPD